MKRPSTETSWKVSRLSLCGTARHYEMRDTVWSQARCTALLRVAFDRLCKGEAIPLQASTDPGGFQEDEAPRFQYNRHTKVTRLSALHTGRLYPQEIFRVLISVRG
jgi:hypothetical protein